MKKTEQLGVIDGLIWCREWSIHIHHHWFIYIG